MAKRKSDIDLARLCNAMHSSRQVLEFHRVQRTHMVKQYVGGHLFEEGPRESVPVNMIAMYVSIVGRSLIAKNPRVMLSTFQRELKPTVSAMQAWANKEIERIDLANTLQRVVVDALFSLGICKVALATPADAASVSWNIRGGEPFAQRVDLDDFVFDTHARDFSEVAFIGHRFRVPLEVVRDGAIYNKKVREKLTASEDPTYNAEGDERISRIGRGDGHGDRTEFEDLVDLWEVYLPRHRLVLTIPDDHLDGGASDGAYGIGEALREQNWLGPEQGPYHLLSLGTVPGNAMPKAPIPDLIDLHEALNRTMRKSIRTIDRIKELLLFQGSNDSDADRINQASDGEAVRNDNPDRIKNVVFSGTALANLLTMAQTLNQTFSRQAGNLDIMGGLAPQSGTASQDRMLDQNSSRSIVDMQERVIGYVEKLLKGLMWYAWNDPIKTQRSQHSVGVAEITREVTPQMRAQGRFEDLDIRVDPYSLQHQTPQTRLAALNQVIQSIVIPMMPILQQQGVMFDVNAYLSKVAQYLDAPDLSDVLTIVEPPSPDAAPSSDKPPMPGKTERTYTRENVPMRTERGDTMNALNALRGVNPGGNPNGNGAVK